MITKLDILDFIKNFRTKEGEFDKKTEGNVCHLFTDGYCYYFAKILEEAYPGGTICKPWPIGHFIYRYNDKYYDIDGEYILEQHDCEIPIPFELPFFIDEKFMQIHKMDYLHNIDYHNTKVDEVRNYELYGVTLDKTETTVLVYLLYNLHCECLLSDEEELSMINCYFKWITEEDYSKLKDIATKLLQSKQMENGEC